MMLALVAFENDTRHTRIASFMQEAVDLVIGLGLLGAQSPFRPDQHRPYALRRLPAGALLGAAALTALSPGLGRVDSGIGVALRSLSSSARVGLAMRQCGT